MSDAEREVLKVLWEHGPKMVREVIEILAEQGQEWARSTVITLLQRLEKKGYVDSDKRESTFVFRAAVTREEVLHARMLKLAGELCDGDALPIVLAFAEQHKFSADELKRFREMIDQLEAKRRQRGSK
jgi:predicted transcriptional regulator